VGVWRDVRLVLFVCGVVSCRHVGRVPPLHTALARMQWPQVVHCCPLVHILSDVLLNLGKGAGLNSVCDHVTIRDLMHLQRGRQSTFLVYDTLGAAAGGCCFCGYGDSPTSPNQGPQGPLCTVQSGTAVDQQEIAVYKKHIFCLLAICYQDLDLAGARCDQHAYILKETRRAR